VAQGGAIGQANTGQMLVAGVDHRRGQLDAQIAAVLRLQQQRREGRIARADPQHLFARRHRQQGDGGAVELAVAAVHRFAHGQSGLAVGVPQLRGQGACVQHRQRP